MSQELMNQIYNPERLLLEISKYRSLDLRTISLDESIELFRSIYNQFHLLTYNIGTVVFRGRKIEDHEPHLLKKDVWCPPPESVKNIGRLNAIGESLFYCAFDPITTIKELRLNIDDYFSLATYNMAPMPDNDLSTIVIDIPTPLPQLQGNHRIYTMILNDFTFNEFTRYVGVGTEFQYKISCAISKLLFETPHKDSIMYPSMIDYKKKNLAIKPDSAVKRLKLVQVIKNQFHGYSENGNPIISTFESALAEENIDELKYTPFHKDARKFELKPDKIFRGENINNTINEQIRQLKEKNIRSK